MKTENKNPSAVEKEMNRFHNEMSFIEQKYKSQRNLIEKQKQSLIDQGKDKVKDVLGGLFGKKKKDTVQKKN